MCHPELDFFNTISGRLEIELDVPAEPIAGLLNVQATPEARIVRLELRAEMYVEETDDFRPLTPEELATVAFVGSEIRLRGEDGPAVTHAAPNGTHFTVAELLRAVEETERQTRGGTEWLGGIDVHHVFFEGIHLADETDDDGGEVWEICWGS